QQQFFRLHSHGHARPASRRRRVSSDLRQRSLSAASPRRDPPHRRRHYFLVLALHDGALDLHPGIVFVRSTVIRSLIVRNPCLAPTTDDQRPTTFYNRKIQQPVLSVCSTRG